MEGLLQDAAKKSSSPSSSSKRPVGAGRYKFLPGVGCLGLWGSLSDGAEVAPNTSVSPVDRETIQPVYKLVCVGLLTIEKPTTAHQEL